MALDGAAQAGGVAAVRGRGAEGDPAGAGVAGGAPGLCAPGMSESRRRALRELKRLGRATIPDLATLLELNVETVREHVKVLASQGLVRRDGTRGEGPGRPELLYALTAEAEPLFPRREGELLRELAAYLRETGREDVLTDFFDRFLERRRGEALARVSGLEGRERLEEAARILSEQGFMALVEDAPGGARLRLCHCPFRELIRETRAPCHAEVGFVRELMGERLTRVSYMPAGDAACSYAAGRA